MGRLYDIQDAEAGKIADDKYSDALQSAGLVWDAETMTAFLIKPKKLVPGTLMSFAGLEKEADIVNLLAYLANP